MSRAVSWVGFVLLLALTVFRGNHGLDRLRADRVVFDAGRLGRAAADGRVASRALLPYIRGLREAQEMDPVSVRVRAARGDLFLLLGRAESAVEAYDDALALEPRAELYFNRGLALERIGRAEEAAADRERALVLDPRLAKSAARGVRHPGS